MFTRKQFLCLQLFVIGAILQSQAVISRKHKNTNGLPKFLHDMIETKKIGLDSETLKDLCNLHSAMMSTAKTLESAIVKQGTYLQITRQFVSIILRWQSVISCLLFIASLLLPVAL